MKASSKNETNNTLRTNCFLTHITPIQPLNISWSMNIYIKVPVFKRPFVSAHMLLFLSSNISDSQVKKNVTKDPFLLDVFIYVHIHM